MYSINITRPIWGKRKWSKSWSFFDLFQQINKMNVDILVVMFSNFISSRRAREGFFSFLASAGLAPQKEDACAKAERPGKDPSSFPSFWPRLGQSFQLARISRLHPPPLILLASYSRSTSVFLELGFCFLSLVNNSSEAYLVCKDANLSCERFKGRDFRNKGSLKENPVLQIKQLNQGGKHGMRKPFHKAAMDKIGRKISSLRVLYSNHLQLLLSWRRWNENKWLTPWWEGFNSSLCFQ